jgi:hypothetical protein
MRFLRKAPPKKDVRDVCGELTLKSDNDGDVVLITAIAKFIVNAKDGDRRVADVSRALTTWAEPRLP